MSEGRKGRRYVDEPVKKKSSHPKRQLVVMLISVAIMVFMLFQVYYLTKYTLGYEISENKLCVYSWVKKLVDGSNTTTIQ